MIDDRVGTVGSSRGEHAYINETLTDRPVTELLKDIAANVQEMVRSEIRLALAEISEKTTRTISAGKVLGMGAGLGVLAVGFVLAGLALVLALFMPIWAATLAVGLMLAIVAAIMIGRGRSQLTIPKPRKTIKNVKDNVEWLKKQTR
jgi:uncharacterized membrane protein YqjE